MNGFYNLAHTCKKVQYYIYTEICTNNNNNNKQEEKLVKQKQLKYK